MADGRHVAALDIGIYCGDEKEQVVCDASKTTEPSKKKSIECSH